MTRIFVFVVLLCMAVAQAPAAAAVAPVSTNSALGDWQGTLDAGGAKLRLAIHLAKSTDGALKASLDSLDQRSTGIPVETVTFTDGKLHLGLQKLGASYDGTVSPDGSSIKGTWTQGGNSLPLDFTKGAVAAASAAADKSSPSDAIRPLWLGTLDAGGEQLRLLVHLARGADGILSATVDSLDQGATGIPVDRAAFKDRKLTLELSRIAAHYEGTANADGTELSGQWSQGGGALPLTLKAIDKAP